MSDVARQSSSGEGPRGSQVPVISAEDLATHLARCLTRPMLVLVLVAAGGLVQLFRHSPEERYLLLFLGGSLSVVATYRVSKAIFRCAALDRPNQSDRLAMLFGFAPYLFGSYLTLYEGLWRLTEIRDGFTLATPVMALAFAVMGYCVVSGVHRATEIARAIDEGRIRVTPRAPGKRDRAQTTRMGSASSTTSAPNSNTSRTLSWVAALITAASILAVAHQLGGDLPMALARQFGTWLGSFAVAGAITLLVVRGSSRHWRGPVSLALALPLFLSQSVKSLTLATEAKQAREVLSTIAGPEDARVKLAANQDNQFVAVAKVANEAGEDAAKEISAIMLALTPPELEGVTSLATATNEELREYHRLLKTAEHNALAAPSQVDFIFQRQRARVITHIESSRLDAPTRASAIEEMARIQQELGSYLKELFALKAREFELSSQVVAVLIREGPRVFVDPVDGKWTFESESALRAFDELATELAAIEQRLAAHIARGEEIDARYRAGFEQAFVAR